MSFSFHVAPFSHGTALRSRTLGRSDRLAAVDAGAELGVAAGDKVTTDIYGHWERAERKLQAAKMEDAFPV